MKVPAKIVAFLLATLFILPWVPCETPIRIATYNIRWFNKSVQTDPKYKDRLAKLKEVIELLEADIIALQEIEDRDALKLLFAEDEWLIVIDDDGKQKQDVAVVVRSDLELPGFAHDTLDAEDNDFLFSGPEFNKLFPNRRDVLCVKVKIPDEKMSIDVMVVHAKSRFGGRKKTDERRVGAAIKIVEKLKEKYAEDRFVLLGDFNDNPDDQSLNILETGDANAPGGMENIPGAFLVNLAEPLVAEDHVSHSLKSNDAVGDRLNTVSPGTRKKNDKFRGKEEDKIFDILFDQILIPAWMTEEYVEGSCMVFDYAVAAKGNNNSRASDHVPVYADFVFDGTAELPEPEEGLWIVALLPNPVGKDDYNEQLTLRNATEDEIDLESKGWRLVDEAKNEYELSGVIPAGASLTITLNDKAMLNNTGDTVWLEDANEKCSEVTYTSAQAKSGQIVTFD